MKTKVLAAKGRVSLQLIGDKVCVVISGRAMGKTEHQAQNYRDIQELLSNYGRPKED